MPPKDKDNDMKITFEGGTFQMGNDSWVPSDGIANAGEVTTATVDGPIGTVDSMDPSGTGNMGLEMSYDFGELNGQMSFDYEGDLRKKYPALKDAWEHYQNVKQMCETREKEEDAN